MDLTLSPLVSRMQDVCQRFYTASGASEYQLTPFFLHGESTACDAAAEFRFQGFEIAFLFNSRLGKVPNVLECRVSLNEGDDRIDFSLYDLMYLLDENDFRCYLFPYIDSPDRMEACLSVLCRAVLQYKEQLSAIGADPALAGRAKHRKHMEMQRFFKQNVFDGGEKSGDPILEWRLRTYRDWYLSRYCSAWYAAYLAGNYEKASKKLSSYDNKSDYELRIYRFLQTLRAGAHYNAAESAADTYTANRKNRSTGKNLICALLAVLMFAAGYLAYSYLAYFIIYRNALYCSGIYSYAMPLFSVLCAIPTGVGAGYLLRKKLFAKENRPAPQPQWDRRRANTLRSMIIMSLLLLTLIAKSGLAMYEAGIVDNTGTFSSVTQLYSDVTDLYQAKDTGMYYLRFADGSLFACPETVANDYVLPYVRAQVQEIESKAELEIE